MIAIAGISYRTASLEIRERYAISPESMPEVLSRAAKIPGVDEVVILSTCNRVEILARPLQADSASEAAKAALAIAQALRLILYAHSKSAGSLEPNVYALVGDDAMRHLFRVTSSLDSLVVGEPQILGQVKQAYEYAKTAGTLRGMLARCIDRSFSVAKRVRTETTLGAGTVSVSSVAVDLARQIFGGLSGHAVLLVGAGEMAESAAKALGKEARSIRVCNRSIERAAELASQFGASASSLDALEEELLHADIVVTSTGSQSHIITKTLIKRVMRARKGRTLFLVDISVPRNVAPEVHGEDNVYVYNVDDLERQAALALSSRTGEVTKANAIVEEEVQNFHKWTRTLEVQPMILALRARTRGILTSELERSLAGKLKHLTESDRAALSQLVESATNKLLHAPLAKLKEKAEAREESDLVKALSEAFELTEVPREESAANLGDSEDERVRVTH
jgi:glutamyl-tRNA reductase